MPRPVRTRRVCAQPKYTRFGPIGSDKFDSVVLSIEEYEVIRHVDYQKMTHGECAKHMDISRTTVTEIYEQARYKIADSLINGKILCIEGGNYRVCEGAAFCAVNRGEADCDDSCAEEASGKDKMA